DMGHFGRGVIRVAWFAVVMPCLLLNYFGQGALMLARNGAVENPFFEISPDWFGIPLLALATVATVIASQAMITGAFAIARQAIEIGYFPPMRIKSTSDQNSLHIFIPRLNMAMMTVTLAIVVIFQSSARLASAYGIAVAVSMLMTSVLFFYWMMKKSGWPKLLAIPLCAVFVLLDSSYVLSNLMKTFEGGWLPLLMGAFVLTAMVAWHRGLEKLVDRHLEYTEPLVDFAARTSRAPLSLVKHTGIFFSRTGTMAPVPLERMADMLHIKFARMVIITIRIESRPYVRAEKRLFAETIGTNILKIEVHYGYQQAINIPATIGATLAEHGIDTDEALYIIGHERVIAPPDPGNVFDLMNILFAILAATAERSVDRFCLPATRTLEIGYPVHLQD
ncbi:MAG: KUP/HAK/KT family potassium transporter, partial [Alphaproteobacteria bacterium]|nr:KUP/HAK/KT family potassium transporter [Alphaproteobacteria bacterium]